MVDVKTPETEKFLKKGNYEQKLQPKVTHKTKYGKHYQNHEGDIDTKKEMNKMSGILNLFKKKNVTTE